MRREKGHGSVTDGRHKRTNGLRKRTSTSSIDIIVFWDILDQRLTVITVHQTSMSPWQGNPTACHWLIWSGNPPALLASITQAADLSTEIGPLLLNGSTQSFYNKLDKPSELAVCQLFKNLAGASEHSAKFKRIRNNAEAQDRHHSKVVITRRNCRWQLKLGNSYSSD